MPPLCIQIHLLDVTLKWPKRTTDLPSSTDIILDNDYDNRIHSKMTYDELIAVLKAMLVKESKDRLTLAYSPSILGTGNGISFQDEHMEHKQASLGSIHYSKQPIRGKSKYLEPKSADDLIAACQERSIEVGERWKRDDLRRALISWFRSVHRFWGVENGKGVFLRSENLQYLA